MSGIQMNTMDQVSAVDMEIQRRIQDSSNLKDLQGNPVLEEDLHIQDVFKLTTEELAAWLSSQLGGHFDIFKKAFMQHKIDGKCFLHLGEAHLNKMEPTSTIGERLNIIAVQQKMSRLARVSRRNQILMQGNCHIEPPGVDGKYVLTNAALKLIFQRKREYDNINEMGFKQAEKLSLTTFVDHVDLSSVGDVDIEQVLDTIEIYRTETQKTGCCCWVNEKSDVVLESRVDKEVAKIFITVNPSKAVAEYDTIVVTPDTVDEARKLQACLIDAMEEVQQVQVVHYE